MNKSTPLSNAQICAVLFTMALFVAQSLFIANIMNMDFIDRLAELFTDYTGEHPFTPQMCYMLLSPWLIITGTCMISIWFVARGNCIGSYIIALSPTLAILLADWIWYIKPSFFLSI